MGKIFDALEKAQRKRGEQPFVFDNNEGESGRGSFGKDALAQNDINELDRSLVTVRQPQSFESEQFKILRANILFPASGSVQAPDDRRAGDTGALRSDDRLDSKDSEDDRRYRLEAEAAHSH